MPRLLKRKELFRTKLAANYGGWIYCESCGQTIGYLCYVTYHSFRFEYRCNCGGSGKMYLSFHEDESSAPVENRGLVTLKNRLCCPNDHSPLLTILSKKLVHYRAEIVCEDCDRKFVEEKK